LVLRFWANQHWDNEFTRLAGRNGLSGFEPSQNGPATHAVFPHDVVLNISGRVTRNGFGTFFFYAVETFRHCPGKGLAIERKHQSTLGTTHPKRIRCGPPLGALLHSALCVCRYHVGIVADSRSHGIHGALSARVPDGG
jgi:hypothetical protein